MSDALTETFEEEYRPLPGDEGGPAAAVAARRRPKYLVAAALFCAGAAFAVPAVIDWQFRANLAANTRLKSKSDPFYDSWASNEKSARPRRASSGGGAPRRRPGIVRRAASRRRRGSGAKRPRGKGTPRRRESAETGRGDAERPRRRVAATPGGHGDGSPRRRRLFFRRYAIGYDIYYFNLTNPHEVAYEGAKPNVTEHGPYSYDQHFVNFDASWITPGRKDVDMYTKTWYEFNAERSHALGCHNCNDTADMLTTWDVVVSGVLEDVAGLPGPISAAGRYALKLAMCAAQKTPKVYPFATRSVRDLHFGRWHDPLLTELVGAIDVLPDAVKSKLPAAFATLTSYVPGFETNYTDKAYARRANGARDRVDSGVRKNGARAMRQTRAWGSRYCRVCLAPTHAGNESQKLQPYCDAQKPEWDHLDEEEGEALANAAGWYLAHARPRRNLSESAEGRPLLSEGRSGAAAPATRRIHRDGPQVREPRGLESRRFLASRETRGPLERRALRRRHGLRLGPGVSKDGAARVRDLWGEDAGPGPGPRPRRGDARHLRLRTV